MSFFYLAVFSWSAVPLCPLDFLVFLTATLAWVFIPIVELAPFTFRSFKFISCRFNTSGMVY